MCFVYPGLKDTGIVALKTRRYKNNEYLAIIYFFDEDTIFVFICFCISYLSRKNEFI